MEGPEQLERGLGEDYRIFVLRNPIRNDIGGNDLRFFITGSRIKRSRAHAIATAPCDNKPELRHALVYSGKVQIP